MLRDMGVEHWVMSPVSGIAGVDLLTEVASLEDALPEGPVVFVDERAEVSLPDFAHPEDATYVLGRANYSPFLAHRRDGDLAVSVPTALTAGLLWPHQAAAIVLYDRLVKSWL
jgi:hypothetical protein